MPTPLEGKHVVLGVTGSIASYKALDLTSKLVQAKARVFPILTENATKFISPLAFASIAHHHAVTDLYDPQSELAMDHIALATQTDLIIIAPATANTLAKIAHGLADDAVTTTVLATRAPIIVAPAMDGNMLASPATKSNLAVLQERGIHIAYPASGRLASGLIGQGRMVEPESLIGHARLVLGRDGDLTGKGIVVSAGGTEEPLDPVRTITNRSSGKMGYAIAEAARDRGASVILVAAPCSLPDPVGVEMIRVATASDMAGATRSAIKGASALIMAAAVSDWTPGEASAAKNKKSGASIWEITLQKAEDIIASIDGHDLVKVGFAAETENIQQNAQAKLTSKGLDLIVANDVTSADNGFGSDNNQVMLINQEEAEELPKMSKYEVGHRILDRISSILT